MCLTLIRGYLFGKMDHWSVDPSNAKNWYTNKLTLCQLIKPLSNWLEPPFTQTACTFDYVYRFRIFVICVCTQSHWHWISGSIGKSDWDKKCIEKTLTQVIRVIERILLLPWTQGVMIQVVERYGANSFFLVLRSVGSPVSLIQVPKQIDS